MPGLVTRGRLHRIAQGRTTSHKIAQQHLFDCALRIGYWQNSNVGLRPQPCSAGRFFVSIEKSARGRSLSMQVVPLALTRDGPKHGQLSCNCTPKSVASRIILLFTAKCVRTNPTVLAKTKPIARV